MKNERKRIHMIAYSIIEEYIPNILQILAISIISTLLILFFPLVIKVIIDGIFLGNSNLLIIMIIVFVSISILGQAISSLNSYLMSCLAHIFLYNLKSKVHEKIIDLNFEHFKTYSFGELYSFYNVDIKIIKNFFINSIFMFINNILTIIIIVAILFLLNNRLAIISFIPIPLYILTVVISRVIAKSLYSRIRELQSCENSIIQDNLYNIKHTKLFNLKFKQMKKFKDIEENLVNKELKYTVFSLIVKLLQGIISLSCVSLVLYWGTKMINDKLITIGTLTATFTYINRLFQPIKSLSEINLGYEKYKISVTKLYDLFAKDDDHGNIGEELSGDIEFSNVSYIKNKSMILSNISFKISQGEFVILQGENGSGKTTIFNLITKLYDVSDGIITIDNKKINEITEGTVRKNISLLTQEDFFYIESIRENLSLGKLSLDEFSLNDDDRKFIDTLPCGFETEIENSGSSFSGGEKKRISIIRLFLKKSSIILLDEPLVSLDTISINYLVDKLKSIKGEKTIVVNTHREELLQLADSIIEISPHGTQKYKLRNYCGTSIT